ncbi:MAG: tetratricopeptide repeat protein [Ignavibacterium sp.]|jgi:tetratricopeptide (TPR) repeat protein|nr:tetratricopeptide repeat protein [Ignavibacterium sp.]
MLKKILITLFLLFPLQAQQNQMDQNLFMLAESYEQQGDLNKAVEIIENLNQKDPNNVQFFNKLNTLYLQLKKYNESVSLIEARIKLSPQDISLYGMLGSTYYTSGDHVKAYKVWEDAINQFKSNQMAIRIISNYAIEKRDFEKAIEYLSLGKKLSKDPYLFSYDLAELYQITMRYREAANEYCGLIKTNSSQYQQIESRVLSYSNKPGALDETIEVVRKFKNENINFSHLLARLLIEKKLFNDAFDIYKEIDKKGDNQGIELQSFADFVYRDGTFETALNVYEYIIDNFNNEQIIPPAKLGYAKSLEALFIKKFKSDNPEWKTYFIPVAAKESDVQPVIDAYKEIITIYNHSEVAIEANLRIGILYEYYLNNNEKAKDYFNNITENYPASKFVSLALIELGNISIRKSRLDEAEKYFQSVANLPRVNQDDRGFSNYMLARIYSFKNDFEQARQKLFTVMDNLKDNIANDAIEFSILLNNAKNDSSNLSLYCKAEYLTEQQKFDEAKIIYDQLAQNPQAFMFHSLAKMRSAEMQIANNDYLNALSALSLIVEEAEKNIYSDKALYLQGRIYQFGFKNNDKAIESYESLLIKFPRSLYLDAARQNIIELKKKIS